MIKLSYFANLFDAQPKPMEFDSFENFESLLYNVSKLKGNKYDRNKPKAGSSPLISPATFDKPRRKNDNVVEWAGWCCVDIDEYSVSDSVQLDLQRSYGHHYYVCYSTASSTEEKPRFRLVFPLTSNVPRDKIKHFWFSLNKELGDIGDGQTKDLARMYYVPAKYPNASNFIFTNKGEYLNPFELMSKHPYVESQSLSMLDKLPPAIRDAIMKEKQSRLINTNYSWSGYSDCPFVNTKLVKEYLSVNETGWYNLTYRIMVSIAASAIEKGYPITSKEIAILLRQLDLDTGNWYNGRSFEREASNAINFVMKNTL